MTSVFSEAQPVLTSKACHGTGARTRPKAMRKGSSSQEPEGSPSSQASCARTHEAHRFPTGLPCCPPCMEKRRMQRATHRHVQDWRQHSCTTAAARRLPTREPPRHAGALQTEPIPPSGAAGKGEQQGFGLPQLLLQMDSSTMLGSGTPGQHNHSTAEPGLGARNAAGELWSRLTPLLSTGYLKQPSEPSQNGHNKQRFTLHGNTATECA